MDIEQIKKLTHLSRLTVPESELVGIANDIGAIVGFIDQIQKVDLVSSEVHIAKEVNVFRDDVVLPLASAYDLIEAAPMHKDHFVMVPKVLE